MLRLKLSYCRTLSIKNLKSAGIKNLVPYQLQVFAEGVRAMGQKARKKMNSTLGAQHEANAIILTEHLISHDCQLSVSIAHAPCYRVFA
jgi:hypothetical protein